MDLIGKKLLVIFEDGPEGHTSKKVGVCTSYDETKIILDEKQIIPQHRLIRCEVVE